MKIATIIGARPQFIKAAFLDRAIRKAGHESTIINTGQHFDYQMSQLFIDELGILNPLNLTLENVSKRNRDQTVHKLYMTLSVLKPDLVIVVGDTETTACGAIAARQGGYPLAHVEAGLRSGNKEQPEETNRILVDQISDYLFCPDERSVKLLEREGITNRVYMVGDIMEEALGFALTHQEQADIFTRIKTKLESEYILVTLHRHENVTSKIRMTQIYDAINLIPTLSNHPVIFPIHPNTRKNSPIDLDFAPEIELIEPVSYLNMVQLERFARVILTDSGGVQREASWLGRPCLILRMETEWPDLINGHRTFLSGYNSFEILMDLKYALRAEYYVNRFVTEKPIADRIIEILTKKG